MDDDLREQIFKCCFRLMMNEDGYYSASDCADEIMKLVETERFEDYRSTVLDMETRQQ